MDSSQKERLINRICSGCVQLGGYLFTWPSAKKLYKADAIYEDSLNSGFDSSDAIELLKKQGRWTPLLEKELTKDIPTVLEDLKFQVYQAYKADKSRIKTLKEKLRKVKDRLIEIISLKRSYDEFTVEWQAERDRTLYLLKECCEPRCYPERLLTKYYEAQIKDEDYREIAKSHEWLIKWNCFKKGIRVFSKNLTPEQENLVKWSTLYENILEQQDCPDDEVIDDDDALDGWMIWKKRENLRAKGLDELENRIKDKDAKEVFFPVNVNAEGYQTAPVFQIQEEHLAEARKLTMYNSPEAERSRVQKLDQINKEGTVVDFQFDEHGALKAGFNEDKVKLAIARNQLAFKGR